jgi:hypothetical protein
MTKGHHTLTDDTLTDKELEHIIEQDYPCSWIAKIVLERREGLSSPDSVNQPLSAD